MDILLTIDVEDWFQVENFKSRILFSEWRSCELRVERNIDIILKLLNDNGKKQATFFMLGWIAERIPHIVKTIYAQGHEIASHGYNHDLPSKQSVNELAKDLTATKNLLEDITGSAVTGYRAPSFDIDKDIIKIIQDCGYTYDSSYNSFAAHDRYGHLDLSGKLRKGIAVKISNNFYELPVSNLNIQGLNCVLPWGGGGYFRIMPFFIFKKGVSMILKNEGVYMMYIHPWEVDPAQPHVEGISRYYKFRHYINLKKTFSKLSAFFNNFKDCNFITCQQYLRI